MILLFEAIFAELSNCKVGISNCKVGCECLVVKKRSEIDFKVKFFGFNRTRTTSKLNLNAVGKKLLCFTNFALSAIILQRSGDVALLLNPGPNYEQLSKKHLHFGHINVNSLRNKIDEISDVLVNTGLHFLGLTETKLDEFVLDGSLVIDGYQLLKRNRNSHGGGVGLYYKDCFVGRVREDLCTLDIEVLWVEFHQPHAPVILVGIFYCPPSANGTYMQCVFNSWERATDEGRDTYILGDFNKDWLSENESSQLRAYSRICGLIQMIDDPTRTVCTARSNTSTCLDLVFTNRRDRVFKSKVVHLGFTDHDLTVLSIKTKSPRGPPKIVHKRSYKHFSRENFINDLKFAPFWMVGSVDDPNEALDIFMNLFKEIVDIHAPLRKYTVKTKPAPWLTDDLRDLMEMRDMAKLEAKTSGYHQIGPFIVS